MVSWYPRAHYDESARCWWVPMSPEFFEEKENKPIEPCRLVLRDGELWITLLEGDRGFCADCGGHGSVPIATDEEWGVCSRCCGTGEGCCAECLALDVAERHAARASATEGDGDA